VVQIRTEPAQPVRHRQPRGELGSVLPEQGRQGSFVERLFAEPGGPPAFDGERFSLPPLFDAGPVRRARGAPPGPRPPPPARRRAGGRGAPAAPAAAAPPAAVPEAPSADLVERRPLKGVRKAIAAQMSRSRREVPEAVAWVDADATRLVELRDELPASHTEVRITPLALILRACVAGLKRFPEVNARLGVEAGEIVVQRFVNLGVAVQTDAGLMVPVIKGAERMSTLDIAAELGRLAAAARERTVQPADLQGSTFTVSNFGSFGIDGGDPVINYPNAAILGVGRIADKPWVVDGQLAVRKVMQLSIAFDHRICDGGEAGGFLRYLADLVESPAKLVAAL
jgi:2-oxoisovalerate dehydrogenase E2 component (dihydrolipoyl transacylase)